MLFSIGKLTKEQIKAGYKALKKIDQCITNKKTGNELITACDAFYTRVPHCFGMQRPPVIRTKAEVRAKIEMLETLGDIEIALKVKYLFFLISVFKIQRKLSLLSVFS